MSRYSLFVLISQGWKRNCLLNKHTHAVQGGLKDLNYVALYPKVNPSQLVSFHWKSNQSQICVTQKFYYIKLQDDKVTNNTRKFSHYLKEIIFFSFYDK